MNVLEQHDGITVLRDDTIEGGTKARFLEKLLDPAAPGYAYATPAYGGFQVALAATAKRLGKQATIFVAKRKDTHPNTQHAKELGAKIIEVPYGYLNVVQARAREHCERYGHQYLEWGAAYPEAIEAIAEATRQIVHTLGEEPEEIWAAVGSGTLLRGILAGTTKAQVHGVVVGKPWEGDVPARATLHVYPADFSKVSKAACPFPSSGNYDRKAWEVLQREGARGKRILFWNVLA